MKNQPFLKRMGYALNGLRTIFRRERSFRTQLLLAAGGVALAVPLRLGLLWYAVLALAIGLVLACEALNASVEYLCDHLHPAFAAEIGRAKDAAAGAVLLASVAAAAVGMLLLMAGVLQGPAS